MSQYPYKVEALIHWCTIDLFKKQQIKNKNILPGKKYLLFCPFGVGFIGNATSQVLMGGKHGSATVLTPPRCLVMEYAQVFMKIS